jgi:hypothetical protein
MDFDQIAKGLSGQEPKPGQWKVARINDQGYTPKFDIVDGEGNRYVLKFDIPMALERNSAAERICTLIMHAVGFNVPHNSIVFFRPDDLYLDEESYYRDQIGKRHPMKQTELDGMLKKLKRLPDGRYRGLASQFINGRNLGRFFYNGIRKDDPNDYIPHEFRRELRGLRVIGSWINHVDVKDTNAMDVFVEDGNGQGYVKHYFLDFGSTMGSGDFVNGPFRVGHEYIYDGAAFAKCFMTLGGWDRPWEARCEIVYNEVGYFEADLFEPEKWKPNYPNLAFLEADDADCYWGAKLVTAFSNETIARLAEAGEYTRPQVTRYVEEVLLRRKDKIGRYWFNRVSPLEDFQLKRLDDGYRLSMRNLARERGYAEKGASRYRYWCEDRKGQLLSAIQTTTSVDSSIRLAEFDYSGVETHNPADRYGRVHLAILFVQSQGEDREWSMPVAVILGKTDASTELTVLGWEHAPKGVRSFRDR